MSSLADKYPVNFGIRASFVHLIDQDGRNLGKTHINDAVRMARDVGMDVVQVAADSSKITCKIMNFGKFKYEMSKTKVNSHHKTKELFITSQIGQHDLETKIAKLKEFISKKYSVVFGIKLKTRNEKNDTEKMKAMLIDCLNSAGVSAEGVDFQFSPDKITVFLR
jgi:translation initiation factor IF-3